MARLSAFLSYKFDKGICESYARDVRQFLELLSVTVHTGRGFQPGSVREKVLQRLGDAEHLLVVIVAVDGLTDFCRDEMNEAKSRKLAIIPLIEDGCGFKPGLFGDIEYIPFEKGHVGDALIRLLEGVRSLEKDNAKAIPARDDNWWDSFVLQQLTGASIAEKAHLYAALQRDDRNFVREFTDTIMQSLKSKGIVKMAASVADTSYTPFCVVLEVWNALLRQKSVLFPESLLGRQDFASLVKVATNHKPRDY